MKRSLTVFIFIVGLALFMTGSAVASSLSVLKGTTPEQRASIQTEFMKTKLDLSGQLLEKVSALNLATAKDLQPVIDGHEGAFSEIKELRAASAKKDTALEALLPADKFALYKASEKELRDYVEAGLKKDAAAK